MTTYRVVLRDRVTHEELAEITETGTGCPLTYFAAQEILLDFGRLFPVLHEARFPRLHGHLSDPRCVVSTLAILWVRVDALTAGDRVRYHGRTWSVLDVIAVAEPLSGTGVLGLDRLTGERRILLYANLSSVAEVVIVQ